MALNIALVRESFEAIKPHADTVIQHFYDELFRRYPQAKPLFARVDLQKQKKALAGSLSHIVEFLEEKDHLADYLAKMGARHADYGTQPVHFDWVGEALLATFEYFFEDQWTSELKSSWVAAYSFIADEMQKGMAAKKQRLQEVKKPEPGLNEYAHRIVETLVQKALKDALDSPELKDQIRLHAQELLRSAIAAEAKALLEEATHYRRSA